MRLNFEVSAKNPDLCHLLRMDGNSKNMKFWTMAVMDFSEDTQKGKLERIAVKFGKEEAATAFQLAFDKAKNAKPEAAAAAAPSSSLFGGGAGGGDNPNMIPLGGGGGASSLFGGGSGTSPAGVSGDPIVGVYMSIQEQRIGEIDDMLVLHHDEVPGTILLRLIRSVQGFE